MTRRIGRTGISGKEAAGDDVEGAPSSSLSRYIKERRSPESCSSFRSSEVPRAGFTTVVLGCLT